MFGGSRVHYTGPRDYRPPPMECVPSLVVSTAGSKSILFGASQVTLRVTFGISFVTSWASPRIVSGLSKEPRGVFLPFTAVTVSASHLATLPAFVFVTSTIGKPVSVLCSHLAWQVVYMSGSGSTVLGRSRTTVPPDSVATASIMPTPVSAVDIPYNARGSDPGPGTVTDNPSVAMVFLPPTSSVAFRDR